MKFKIIAVFIITISCFASSLANGRIFEIEVSMKETNILKSAKEIPVKVTIHNKSEKPLNVEGDNTVSFLFSKCWNSYKCAGRNSIIESTVKIPRKTIEANKSLDFETNLAELSWKPISQWQKVNDPGNFFTAIPSDNIFFQISVSIKVGYKKSKSSDEMLGSYNRIRSDTITVVRE